MTSNASVTHWRIDRRAPNVERKSTKSVYVSCSSEERYAIVQRVLFKFEIRRNTKVYAWWTLQLDEIFMQLNTGVTHQRIAPTYAGVLKIHVRCQYASNVRCIQPVNNICNVCKTSFRRVLCIREAQLSVYRALKKRMLAYAWRFTNVDGMHATKEKCFLNVFETRPGRILDVLLWCVCCKHTHIRFSLSRTILKRIQSALNVSQTYTVAFSTRL